jgi:hypothetical protein
VQDKVIRRLNVVGLGGTEDGKVTITNGVNLTHIRSLTILGRSNWIPFLLEFKFVRVLSLDLYSFAGHEIFVDREMTIDLTVINQLLQLRYLKIHVDSNSINITLPCQIRGLRLLETLDLSGIFGPRISSEIVEAPHLSHLVMSLLDAMILPDWIGKVKSLRTLRGFILSLDPLESIVGLGQLTALSDLMLGFPQRCAGLSKATWMTALSTSLDKLSNLKQLSMTSHFPYVALCADALSSLSPPFLNLELLHLGLSCTFSRVPGWISHLRNLRDLWFGVKQVLQEDIDIIGTRLPSLIHLDLRIPAGISMTERIVIGGTTGFPILRWFRFNCDRMSFLAFEAGAMPALGELELVFDADEWDKAAPAGLEHLPTSLKKIKAQMACYPTGPRRLKANDEEDEKTAGTKALIRSVFQEAADALPTRPAFTFNRGKIVR